MVHQDVGGHMTCDALLRQLQWVYTDLYYDKSHTHKNIVVHSRGLQNVIKGQGKDLEDWYLLRVVDLARYRHCYSGMADSLSFRR